MTDLTQRSRMMIATLALAATLGAAATAQADDVDRPGVVRTQIVVDYADLDLGSVVGNRTLYARLSHAAARACGPEPESRDLHGRSDYRQCREKALAKAVDRVGSPELQALHAGTPVNGVS
jgi:UrcA family protein